MGKTKLAPTTTLNTGVKMPMIALGTWQSGPKEVEEAVYYAIGIGYRMFDTATDYIDSYLMHWPFGLMPGDRSDYGL